LDEFPVSSQFVLMKIVPIQNCRQRPPRKPALDDAAVNFNRDFMLPILRVEMRCEVVALVHPNNDSEKSADFGHWLEKLRKNGNRWTASVRSSPSNDGAHNH
jgi:hypothetical protein